MLNPVLELDRIPLQLILSLSLSLSLTGNFPFAESVLRFVLSRSSRADKFILLYRTSISLVQARRKEAKSTKVNTHQ